MYKQSVKKGRGIVCSRYVDKVLRYIFIITTLKLISCICRVEYLTSTYLQYLLPVRLP